MGSQEAVGVGSMNNKCPSLPLLPSDTGFDIVRDAETQEVIESRIIGEDGKVRLSVFPKTTTEVE